MRAIILVYDILVYIQVFYLYLYSLLLEEVEHPCIDQDVLTMHQSFGYQILELNASDYWTKSKS